MGDIILRFERAPNVLSLLPPDLAVTVGSANQVFLMVYGSEEHIASDPNHENNNGD